MKRISPFKLIFIILTTILLINIAIFYFWRIPAYDHVNLIKPNQENMRVSTKIYYVTENFLKELTVNLTIMNNNYEQSALSELKRNDQISEKSISEPTNILSTEVENSIVYVNFSPEFLTNGNFKKSNFYLHLMSIVNTMTEFSKFNKVQFLIDGKKVKNPLYGVDIFEPFSRDESLIEKKQESSDEFLTKFLSLIEEDNINEAFTMLNLNQNKIEKNDFKIIAQEYITKHIGYSRSTSYTQSFNTYDVITVISKEDTSETDYSELYEEYKVIKEENNKYIDFAYFSQTVNNGEN
jgi:hypothetical protein